MSNFIQTKTAKTVYFVFGILAISAVMFFLMNNSKIAASGSTSKIVFETEVHDFGKVAQGPQLEYTFKFSNKGKGTLLVEKVQTSCGCTGATTGGKTEYSKGENGEIKVTFNTQGRQGRQEKQIMVFTNDPEHPQVALRISCDIDGSAQ